MQGIGNRSWLAGVTLALTLAIAGCTAPPRGPAPVEDRGTMTRAPGASTAMPGASGVSPLTVDASGKPLPGIENYGKPGYYAVRPGDTIRRIGNETGQTWQNIVRWNNLENADLIEVGQVLRVIPPGETGSVVARPVTPQPAIVPAVPAVPAVPGTPGASGNGAVVAATPSAPAKSPVAAGGDEELGWIWPARGALIAGFDEAKNKGYDIGGKAGDPVIAAADGRVVYAGAGLRGYGNLIILKHNNTYLTAYAHNQSLLVKEDQSVQKGQKIAEMGSSDADRVKLHFEIRRQGKPVDPSRYLPSR
ncbi:peptidoglycan DD-metalloendopeptidase family protein [Variovorax sp. RHLX14]|uniref:peptidoglycan DD-metalloendopeptidase family protein n=1 Tax=Variovorax sp. RHLX14 TaxID=1259731 RepID=UPI003F446A7B